MPFRLCLNTSTIRPQPLLDKIRLAAEAGFDSIELWLNDVYEHVGRGGEVRDLESCLSDHGLTVPCTIAIRQWAEASEEEYPLALDEARRRMELAARLGSPAIVATPPRGPCALDQVRRRYLDLLELGRRVGVTPLLEYISFFRSLHRLDQAWKVVAESRDPDAALVIDSFHTWNGGSSPRALESIPVERIRHVHIDDADPSKPRGEQTDPDRVLPGDGPIPLAEEIALLRRKGYSGAFSLELFNRKLWARDPREVLREGIERLRALLA